MSDANEEGEALGPALAVLTNHDEAAQAEAVALGFVPPAVEYDLPDPEQGGAEAPSSASPPSTGEGAGEGAGASDGGAQANPGDGSGSGESEAAPQPE